MKYKHLTKDMRRQLKSALDKGETTPEKIRHNIRVQQFIDHQDEILPQLDINNQIRELNKKQGLSIPTITITLKPEIVDSDITDNLDYEVEYYLNWYTSKYNK